MAVATPRRIRPRLRPDVRRAARPVALVLAVLALAFAGVWAGLRLSSPGQYDTDLGRVSVQVTPSFHGEIEAFIPLADWGVRTRPFSAPIKVHVEPRTVQRDVVVRAASGNDESLLKSTEDDLRRAVRSAALRAVRWALAGAAALAALVTLLLYAGGERRRRLLAGLPVAVMVVAAAGCAGSLARAAATFDSDGLDHPTFYARGAELVQLLDAAENARHAGDDYESKLEGAVQGFATLLSDPTAGRVEGGRRAILVSDLHNNRFALDSLGAYTHGKTVFFPGDFGNTGSAAETRLLVPPISRLGSRVIAVSGNHDSSRMMRALAAHGVTVLTRNGVLRPDGRHGPKEITVEGLVVAGFDDPQEWHGRNPNDPRRIFSINDMPDRDAALARARRALVRWFDGLPSRPDVVLIHQNGLAQYLGRVLAARHDDRPVTILTGHDHQQHVDRHLGAVVVDAGTVGASGLYGVGKDYVGLGDLHFAPVSGALQAADLIAVEPVSGQAQARRVINEPCQAADGQCQLFNAPIAGNRPG
jgi:predicted phosphodiesterase